MIRDDPFRSLVVAPRRSWLSSPPCCAPPFVSIRARLVCQLPHGPLVVSGAETGCSSERASVAGPMRGYPSHSPACPFRGRELLAQRLQSAAILETASRSVLASFFTSPRFQPISLQRLRATDPGRALRAYFARDRCHFAASTQTVFPAGEAKNNDQPEGDTP